MTWVKKEREAACNVNHVFGMIAVSVSFVLTNQNLVGQIFRRKSVFWKNVSICSFYLIFIFRLNWFYPLPQNLGNLPIIALLKRIFIWKSLFNRAQSLRGMRTDKWHTPSTSYKHILETGNNWQWNKRGPILEKVAYFHFKNPLNMDFKGWDIKTRPKV